MVTEEVVKQRVSAAVREADLNAVTAKQIRRTVEKQLNLQQDELASGKWKAIVSATIEGTLARIERGDSESQDVGVARDSDDEIAPKRIRRKRALIQVTPPSSPAKLNIKSSQKLLAAQATIETQPNEPSSQPKKKQRPAPQDESDSELSVLNDATPPSKNLHKPTSKDPSQATKSKTKASGTAKSSIKTSEDEIKHLKSLVFKCGVRKNWSKELASSMSSSEQIAYVKAILHSLGMTGRLSAEKAKKIKEERELRDELAFIQEGAKNVGTRHRRRNE